MQIYNNPSISYQTNPNFQAIKTVKCEGLYRKSPELGKELVQTFKTNPKVMDFCRKFDVDVVFYACKKAMSAVESSIHIFFENPAKKLFLGFLGRKRDEISLTAYEDKYSIEDSLKASTDLLKAYISEEHAVPNKPCGLLDSHIGYKQDEIQKFFEERDAKYKAKLDKDYAKTLEVTKTKNETEELNDSIQDLINSSK